MARYELGTIVINKHDIVGKRFGRLYVIKYHAFRYDNTAGGDKMRHFYLCKCDCGNTLVVHRHSLINGNTKSCGCLKRKERNHGN